MTSAADPSREGLSLRVDAEGDLRRTTLEEPAPRAREVGDPPFCIGVLGDFSGRGRCRDGGPTEADWTPVRISPDNAPELAGLVPRLELSLDGEGRRSLELSFRTLSDFHPDSLFASHPIFADLREARAAVEEGRAPRLRAGPEDGEGGRDAGEERTRAADGGAAGAEGSPANGGGSLLDAIVDVSDAGRGAEARSEPTGSGERGRGRRGSEGGLDPELREFVRKIVEPHRVRPTPDRSEELASVDEAISAVMRRVLHHGAFRALESLWRSLVFLLSRIDTTGKVRIYLVDIGRRELERDLSEAPDPRGSRLHRLLAAPDLGPAASRWGLVVGAYRFGGSPEDLPVVEGVARTARAADVPWLSAADPRLAGCPSLEAAADPRDWSSPWPGEWAGVPRGADARWLGLALPRFLAREPYGEVSGRRCRAFDLEEVPEGPVDRGALLWGNPAFACAVVLARAFARDGWRLSPNADLDIGQVPIARAGSAPGAAPAITEARLTPAAAERLAESGLIPVVAFAREARLRVGGIRSVAGGSARLRAWWRS